MHASRVAENAKATHFLNVIKLINQLAHYRRSNELKVVTSTRLVRSYQIEGSKDVE